MLSRSPGRLSLAVAALVLALACAGPRDAEPSPGGLQIARVLRVIDGDTIDVLIDGRELRVRYIGIDTPETVDPRRPVECFGRQASERNRQLVEGRTVGLERDVSETDRFGRLLRYVWVDGEMVNATLVEEGYATATTYPPDVKYADLFASLQGQAREAGRGLWSTCATPQAAASPPYTESLVILDIAAVDVARSLGRTATRPNTAPFFVVFGGNVGLVQGQRRFPYATARRQSDRARILDAHARAS